MIGLAFEGGVIVCADTLGSYGSMARYRDVARVWEVNKDTIVGVSGDYADFQHVWKTIEQKRIDEEASMDGHNSGPLALHTWLTRLQYNKRCRFEPYWVEWVVAGIQNGEPFLGYVDKLGESSWRGKIFMKKLIFKNILIKNNLERISEFLVLW